METTIQDNYSQMEQEGIAQRILSEVSDSRFEVHRGDEQPDTCRFENGQDLIEYFNSDAYNWMLELSVENSNIEVSRILYNSPHQKQEQSFVLTPQNE